MMNQKADQIFRPHLNRQIFKINISPSAVQKFASSHASRQSRQNQQVPFDGCIGIRFLPVLCRRLKNTSALIMLESAYLLLGRSGHVNEMQWVLIKLSAMNSELKDSLQLTQLLGHSSRTITSIKTGLDTVAGRLPLSRQVWRYISPCSIVTA
jgi:hypothetical protein